MHSTLFEIGDFRVSAYGAALFVSFAAGPECEPSDLPVDQCSDGSCPSGQQCTAIGDSCGCVENQSSDLFALETAAANGFFYGVDKNPALALDPATVAARSWGQRVCST